MHRVRDEWEFGASTELRGPEAFTLSAELRKQHPHAAERGVLPALAKGALDNTFSGSLTMQGPAGDSQMLLRPSTLILPTVTLKQHLQADRMDKVMGYPQLKMNNHLLLSTTPPAQALSPYTPHLQKPYSKEQS